MNQERVYQVLMGPHISEKASLAAESGQVVFKVAPTATKVEIKAAVEQLFDVKVLSVSVLNQKGKVKRTARGLGKRNGLRKAYVTLAEGQEIDFLDVE
ncbi:MAG: 50S ribosomal protein L23 [Hahellaceae bacterium]|nr:50S ribosomal protein L23 [Hahellaceae bacterium]MCP5210497.1 50S ribosomal protein L23 [Hahellaceae bacterium]